MEPVKVDPNRGEKPFPHLIGKPVELYNAVTGSSYPPDIKAEITALEEYAGLKNSIALQLDGKCVFIAELRSGVDENLPSRLLCHAARMYRRLLTDEIFYREKPVRIPTPEFIVLYSGEEEFPEEMEYRLSDVFLAEPQENSMELRVRVINVNKGNSVVKAFLEKSKNDPTNS